jgi:glycosyltransferase involved in cell wall biosynthesis
MEPGHELRVLWFTNIELPAVRRRISSPVFAGGGWMESLRSAIQVQGSVQLGVAAVGATPFAPFDEEGVRYFHLEVPSEKSGFGGVAERWHHRPNDGAALAGAAAVIESFKPDLIHVHGSEGPYGLLASTSRAPLVISLQGLVTICSRFYFAGIPSAEVLRDAVSVRFAKGRGLVHASWNMRVQARREMEILRSCRFFAGRTDWDRSVVSLINPDARYYHAEEVLRPEFYHHQWRGSADDPFVVYTTGGPAPYKGLVNLLEAVALLRESVRKEVKLRVGGRIQGTSMWPIARRTVDRLRLGTTVTWLGPLPAAAVAAELEGASVYVHPSLVDNSPSALAEAMTVGVPCVASSAGGIPSMITHGTDGLLCGPNDVYGLAGRIAAIEADPLLAARLGSNARALGRQRHDPAAVAGATVTMYAEIIALHQTGDQ